MNPKFVVSHLDQQLGPFDEQELRAKWGKGELLPIDYVYDEAKNDWILLAERFDWAAGLADVAPPPLKADGKRKAPPAPTQNAPGASSAPAIKTHPVLPILSQIPPANPIAIQSETLVSDWRKPGSQGAKVKIIDGVGELDLSELAPGQLEVALQDSSAGTLKLQDPLKIQVLPVEPQDIQWNFAAQQTVGKEAEITFKAVDAKGNLCSHYADDFVLKVSGGEAPREHVVRLAGGQASLKLNHTKSESWRLELAYQGKRALRLPEAKAIDWQPGPAARLILDGPPELVAGNPLKVQVKAVDQYGNLAKTFQGTVILEVKAS